MALRAELRNLNRTPRILILGSGGLSIGQAGEFDYSGTQAVKALREEGLDVIVVNPNIATVQTNPSEGCKIYLYPVEPEWVEKVIEKEKPDGIIAGFGGQTALNCVIALDEQGILKKHNVLNLGTSVDTLRMSEDRDEFAENMKQIGMPIPESFAVNNYEDAENAAGKIGYPVIVRAAYACGGLGSGFANNDDELKKLVIPALKSSPQVLVEKSLKGWKEVEYEVMRDSEGNVITICNMENFDPLGIHTGDSIVVCPSQSLSDEEYQRLRNASITIVNHLNIVGECNVQLALSPDSYDFYVIEVNARLSRSSALASKASGYPIAYIAAKVVLGYDLLELKNPVTGVTFAFFEPALDYVTVKFPRWDLQKFQGVNRVLGSTMKSVGEIMSIGRSFPEALQKAVRMVTENPIGLSIPFKHSGRNEIIECMTNPTDKRLYAIAEGLRVGMTSEEIHSLTGIDKWFLSHIELIVKTEHEIKQYAEKGSQNLTTAPAIVIHNAFANVEEYHWRLWKSRGFGDQQIAQILLEHAYNKSDLGEDILLKGSLAVRERRLAKGVKPVIKKIDTTAAEYPSPSNYLYMSYNGRYDDPIPKDNKIFSAVVLGGGSYRIGTSVEFDWCAVSCSQRLQNAGWRSVVINCNPETVSTDYNSSDHLFFDEISIERVLDVVEFENAVGVIASMGGQLPNKLALSLAEVGIKLLGHSPEAVDTAEDRSKFSALLDELKIDQPRWIAATSKKAIEEFISEVGFPVLIRPSYVLSGAAMNVAFDNDSLSACLSEASDLSTDHPVVITEFIEGAREIEVDGVARNGEIVTAVVSEHIENAGVHSGDATTVVPAQYLEVETVRRVRKAARKMAEGLRLNGPFNMQFLAKDGEIRVIETNVRAARSFPFVSKVVSLNLADVATDVMIGREPLIQRKNEDDLPYVGVKAAMFSFKRLGGADPILGVEMASTGEVGCIAESFDEALLLALQATGAHAPKKGVFVSSGREHQKLKFLKSAGTLRDLGLKMYGTDGTAKYLREHGFEVETLAWPGQKSEFKDCLDAIRDGDIDMVINIPKNSQRDELELGAEIRRIAVQFGCSLFTNIEKTNAYIKALARCHDFIDTHEVLSLPNYRS